MNDLEFKNYKITWEALENQGDIPEFLNDQLQDIYKEIQKPIDHTIKRLKRLVKKYPNNLQLKNYLSTVYNT